jgi:hypothetical protein
VDIQKAGADRRRFDRYLVDYPISYNLKNINDISTGLAMNLSEGGLLACFFDRIGVGAELDLEMFYAFELQFTCLTVEAKIVWKDIMETSEAIEYQYGLEFTGMDQHQRNRLRRLLASMDSTQFYPLNGQTVMHKQSL